MTQKLTRKSEEQHMNKLDLHIAGEPQKLLVATGKDQSVNVYAIPARIYSVLGLQNYNQTNFDDLPQYVKDKIDSGGYQEISVSHVIHV